MTVPKTDTGELIEKIKTNEITILKELGKFTPYVRKKEYLLRFQKLGVATV